ncbi:MAG: hypothetical protein HY255_05665 [Betaproteobacteria bacterium]|nr:hypothetical protein [Betaproteobacteria bacterium]
MSGTRLQVLVTILLVAASLTLAEMPLGNPDALNLIQVRRGQSFGECGSQCWNLIELGRSNGHYSEGTFNRPARPYAFDVNLSPSEWRELEAIAARSPIRKKNETIGCPDCADGGAEWIELAYGDGTKWKVTFDCSSRPPALREIAGKLDQLAAAYRARQPRRATDAIFDPIKL